MKLSIVIPVFNSSQILETLIQKIEIHVIRKKKNTQVILVNDHSLDDSWQKIRDLKKKYEFIKGVNLKKNYGQHSAIFCGLKNCDGDKIVCMDDDMQHDPEHILKMIDQLDENDVCYVKYKKREHNYTKILISKLNNIVSSFLMEKSSKIYTSSFKCFNKKISDQIILNDENFIFLDYWIFKYAKNITFVEVRHNKRFYGKTNYGFRELLTLWSKMIFLIDVRKGSFRYYIILVIKNFFKLFLKDYVRYESTNKIEISDII